MEGFEECLCIHAEENALLEAGRERVGKGAVLYCNTCVPYISELKYAVDWTRMLTAKTFLSNSGVPVSNARSKSSRRASRRSYTISVIRCGCTIIVSSTAEFDDQRFIHAGTHLPLAFSKSLESNSGSTPHHHKQLLQYSRSAIQDAFVVTYQFSRVLKFVLARI